MTSTREYAIEATAEAQRLAFECRTREQYESAISANDRAMRLWRDVTELRIDLPPDQWWFACFMVDAHENELDILQGELSTL